MNELVSVIIPTFGRPTNLERAIKSALAQTYESIEIIIVDDNPPESEERARTENAVAGFLSAAPNVHYLKHPENRNGAAARNTGLRAAKGAYVAFLDDDDEFLPSKLAEQVSFLERHPQFQGCYCRAQKIKNGTVIHATTFEQEGDFSLAILSLRAEVNSSALLLKCDAIEALGGFDEAFRRHQDYEFLLRFMRQYKVGCVRQRLLRIHTDSERRVNLSPHELYQIKQNYFASFKEFIGALPLAQQREIYTNHYLELAFYSLRTKHFRAFLYFLAKSKPTPVQLLHYCRGKLGQRTLSSPAYPNGPDQPPI